ncbi:MAG: acyltransferase family protein [Lachnotalea sp.]
MKERNTSLDAMKGFAILLVMIGHVLEWNEMTDPYLYAFIEAVQMPIFIMLNGYICGLKLPITNFGQWKNTISKRATAYVVPFFMWLLLKQWDDIIRGFKNALFQLDRALWFLMTLFILNVILYTAQLLSNKFRKNGKLQGFIAFGIAVGMLSTIFVGQLILKNRFLSPILTLRYLPAFIIGYLVSAYKEDIVKLVHKNLQLVAFVSSIVLFIYMCVIVDTQIQKPFVILGIQIFEGLIGSYIIFYIFLKSKESVIKEKLARLGKYTLEIYVIHFHFARILNRGHLDFGLYSIKGILFVIASFVAMSITTAALIYMAKQSPLTNFLMFGKRSSQKSKG